MELVEANQMGTTIRLSRQESNELLALFHAIGVDHDKLDAQIHHLSEDHIRKLRDDFFDLAERARIERDG